MSNHHAANRVSCPSLNNQQTTRRRLGSLRLPPFTFLLLLLFSLSHASAEPKTTSTTTSTTSSSRLASAKSKAAALPKNTQTTPSSLQKLVQVWETEVYNGTDWKGSTDPSRWTLVESPDRPCDPPTDLLPPAGYVYQADWKIVTSHTRDQLGWEYFFSPHGPPLRRRTWLRTLRPVVSEASTAATRISTTTTTPTTHRHRHPLSSAWQLLKDDWNFKGFGWSFYKSLLFRESCGVAFRIPLTLNLDSWERNPNLPSITSSIALYHPFTAALLLSASWNVHHLKYSLRCMLAHVQRALQVVVYTWLQIAVILIALPLSILTNRPLLQLLPELPAKVEVEPPAYQLGISERIGMSLSWRISNKRGYEFRVSYWHSYLPTALYMSQVLQNAVQQVPNPWKLLTSNNNNNNKKNENKGSSKATSKRQDSDTSSSSSSSKFTKVSVSKSSSLLSSASWSEWLRRHTGSLGLSTGRPTPDPPHFSCSAVWSLSGFYYRRGPWSGSTIRRNQQQRQQQRQASISVRADTNAAADKNNDKATNAALAKTLRDSGGDDNDSVAAVKEENEEESRKEGVKMTS